MASVFDVDNFLAKVDGLGSFIRKNRYTVQIVPPSNMHVPVNIEFLVKQVSFPARTMGTTNFRYGGKYGLEIPYDVTEFIASAIKGDIRTMDCLLYTSQSPRDS